MKSEKSTKKQTEVQALAIECLHSLSAEDAIRTVLEALRLHPACARRSIEAGKGR